MVKEEIQEIWKDIKDYEGLYQVSNLGRIRSLDKMVWNGQSYWEMKGKILIPGKDKDGYLQIGLYKNKKRKGFKIHRLVSEYFIENEENKPEVNHKDGNKQNNNANNLEWVTSSENSTHAYNIGLLKVKKGKENPLFGKYKGELNPMYGKIGEKNKNSIKVKCITTQKEYGSIRQAATLTGLDYSCIAKCCKGKVKSCGKHPLTGEKLVWKYLEDSE